MPSIIERMMENVAVEEDGCWEWCGATCGHGKYGAIRTPDGMKYVHRVSYEAFIGDIPDGMQVDHLCRNRTCVNPEHLEAVSHYENMRRGSAWAVNKGKTHCPSGHPYSGDNLYINPSGGRECRTCKRLRGRKYDNERRVRLTKLPAGKPPKKPKKPKHPICWACKRQMTGEIVHWEGTPYDFHPKCFEEAKKEYDAYLLAKWK